MTRALLMTAALALGFAVAPSASACINDSEVENEEREFRSRYAQEEQGVQASNGLALPLALALGILAALYRNSIYDRTVNVATLEKGCRYRGEKMNVGSDTRLQVETRHLVATLESIIGRRSIGSAAFLRFFGFFLLS